MNEHDDAPRRIFSVGDLIWVKLGKYPFWPCMVSFDPIQGDCIRFNKDRNERLYHVQFFGVAPQRGWTVAGNIFEFRGESAYFERTQNLLVANASRGAKFLKKLKAKYGIPASSRRRWEIAVKEAEEAAQISNLGERFRNYVFDYEKLKSKKSSKATGKKGKQKSTVSSGEVVEQTNSISNGEEVKQRNSVSAGIKIKPTRSVSTGGKGKHNSSVSSGERAKLRSSISSGEGVKRRTSVSNVAEEKAKQRNSISTGVKVKQKRTAVTDSKGEPKSSNFNGEGMKQNSSVCDGKMAKRKSSTLYGTASGSCLKFDKSAHCSKRIRLSDDSSQICDVCDKENSDLACTGICGKFFHMECLGITNIPENFRCAKCSSGLFSCFACKMSSGTLKECANSKCTKYYHAECLDQYECTNKDKNICPLHTCLTCYRENPRNSMSHKGNMVQCLQCPTSFHSRESCIAAGSVEKSSSTIICSLHFDKIQKSSGLKTSNTNYCTVCCSGGELVCCETCPNAYHENCLESDIPNEDFICEDCRNRRYLFYDMVVFGKSGKFSWWPGQIIHESHLSDAVKRAKKCDGQFAVYFFGTHNYSWLHGGRVYPYEEEHKKMKLKNRDKKFKLGLQEAIVAFEEYQRNRLTDSLLDKRPEAYRHIQVNRALPPAQIYSNLSNISKCSCDPTKEDPCGPDSECLNRSMLMECHADFCPAKDLCQNQKFQKRQYVPTKIFKTTDRGWGLLTLQDVKKGEFIIEYVGEIITHEEYRRRSAQMLTSGNSNYYFLYLDSRRMIDAGPMGNYSRFINHSCEPNCEMRKWSVNGDARIGIFAVVDISADEELTFNYQSDKYEFEQKCLCSSPGCRGFIGRTTDNHLKLAGMASKPSTSKAVTAKIPSSNTEAQSVKRNKKNIDSSRYKNFIISPLSSATSSSSSSSSSSSTTSDSSSTCSSVNSSDYTSDSHSGSFPTSSSSTTNDSSSTTIDSSSSTGTSSSTTSTSGSSDSSIPSTSGYSQESEVNYSIFSAQEREQLVSSFEKECCSCTRKTPEWRVMCSVTDCLKHYHLNCINVIPILKGEWFCEHHRVCCCARDPNRYCFWCLLGLCTNCLARLYPNEWNPPPFQCSTCGFNCQCFNFIDSFSSSLGDLHSCHNSDSECFNFNILNALEALPRIARSRKYTEDIQNNAISGQRRQAMESKQYRQAMKSDYRWLARKMSGRPRQATTSDKRRLTTSSGKRQQTTASRLLRKAIKYLRIRKTMKPRQFRKAAKSGQLRKAMKSGQRRKATKSIQQKQATTSGLH